MNMKDCKKNKVKLCLERRLHFYWFQRLNVRMCQMHLFWMGLHPWGTSLQSVDSPAQQPYNFSEGHSHLLDSVDTAVCPIWEETDQWFKTCSVLFVSLEDALYLTQKTILLVVRGSHLNPSLPLGWNNFVFQLFSISGTTSMALDTNIINTLQYILNRLLFLQNLCKATTVYGKVSCKVFSPSCWNLIYFLGCISCCVIQSTSRLCKIQSSPAKPMGDFNRR